MRLEDHELQPATVLRGHVSPDTAYHVDDYPYGFTLRCKIRYWLHVADKGQYAGRVRLMSQTTNPKVAGEPWNKPKGTTYAPWAVLIRDSRDYITWWAVDDWGPDPEHDLLMRLRTIYDQLNDEERKSYDRRLQLSRTYNPEQWDRIERAYEPVGAGTTSDELRHKHHLYIDERSHQILTAACNAGLEL